MNRHLLAIALILLTACQPAAAVIPTAPDTPTANLPVAASTATPRPAAAATPTTMPTPPITPAPALIIPPGVMVILVEGAVRFISLDRQQQAELPGTYYGNEVDWSPDGSALLLAEGDIDVSGLAEIFRFDLRSGARQRLTSSPANQRSPRWSPDGSQILLFQIRRQVNQIYLLDARGSYLRYITDGVDPRWSPDGAAIAYVKACDASPRCLYLRDLKSGAERMIAANIGVRPYNNIAWSPDGVWIAYISGGERADLWLHHLDTGRSEQITDTPAEEAAPEFSPDSQFLAYVVRHWDTRVNESGQLEAAKGKWASVIRIQRLSSGAVLDFHLTDGYIDDFAWSAHPDAALVFTADNRE